MRRSRHEPVATPSVAELRRRSGMSRGRLSRLAELQRGALRAIERGARPPTDAEVDALALAFGVAPTAVRDAAMVSGRSNRKRAAARPDADSDRLLREYILMVQELRNAQDVAPSSLRQNDLSELAHALGGTPEAIEARLMELLDTDREHAEQLRASILPSW